MWPLEGRNVERKKQVNENHTVLITTTSGCTWKSVMTFADGKLYDERAALLNKTSMTAKSKTPYKVCIFTSTNQFIDKFNNRLF